ncbi:DsbA family protein [Pseudomonas aeruginosa]
MLANKVRQVVQYLAPQVAYIAIVSVIISAVALLVIGCAILLSVFDKPSPIRPWAYGQADSRWTINEFADLECPYCKAYTPRLKRWVDSQLDVNLVWRHLPLQTHDEEAQYPARLAECAGIQGGTQAFWEAIDTMLTQPPDNSGRQPAGMTMLPGLNQFQLEECIRNNKLVALLLEQDLETALSQGITGTPTLIIQDNKTGRTLKLEGMADDAILLSAIDWLAQSMSRSTHSEKK